MFVNIKKSFYFNEDNQETKRKHFIKLPKPQFVFYSHYFNSKLIVNIKKTFLLNKENQGTERKNCIKFT